MARARIVSDQIAIDQRWRRPAVDRQMHRFIILLVLVGHACDLIFALNDLCSDNASDHLPLRYAIATASFVVTNPCQTDDSILIRESFLYQFHRDDLQWKQLCIAGKLVQRQVGRETGARAHTALNAFVLGACRSCHSSFP